MVPRTIPDRATRFSQGPCLGRRFDFQWRRGLAEELVRTPQQTEGPFYPDHLPLDTDNDLLIVNDALRRPSARSRT